MVSISLHPIIYCVLKCFIVFQCRYQFCVSVEEVTIPIPLPIEVDDVSSSVVEPTLQSFCRRCQDPVGKI